MFENQPPSPSNTDQSAGNPPPSFPPTPTPEAPKPFGEEEKAEDIFSETDQAGAAGGVNNQFGPPDQPMAAPPTTTDEPGPAPIPPTPFTEPKSGGMNKRLMIWLAVLIVIIGAGVALYFFTDLFSPLDTNSVVTNSASNLNQNATTNTVVNLNTNTTANANLTLNTSLNSNVNSSTNLNTNVATNTNTANTNTANLNTSNTNTASTLDTDNDSLTDEEEYALGTLINNRDSDGDGLSDYAEVKFYNTDPLNQDSDGDGYDDGTEVENGFNPNGTGAL
ncbi:MAG: thrombospondin type 3 repeat-containing protein [Patescibacteria group bacterium]